MKYKIHPLSDVQSTAIGEGTSVWQFCVVLKGAVIGNECNICAGCLIENDVKIGNRVTIKSGVQIWDNSEIHDDVFIGPNVTFTNDLIPRSKSYKPEWKKTVVKQGATIGANATLIAEIEIGEYAFIGAGSVVTKSIKPYTLWYGNPARHKGYITKDAIVLGLDFKDKITGDQFVFDNNQLVKVND